MSIRLKISADASLDALLKRLETARREGWDPSDALTLIDRALEKIDVDQDPLLTASLKVQEGHCHLARLGEREDTIGLALIAYEDAFALVDEGWPRDLSSEIALSLANVLLETSRDERRKDLSRAIALFETYLPYLDRTVDSTEWAEGQNNLGYAYWARSRLPTDCEEELESEGQKRNGDPEKDIEDALTAHRRALRVRRKDRDPIGWAESSINLALAYADRLRQRAQSLERAIVYGQRAVDVLDPSEQPRLYAIGSMNLALAYWDRLLGDRSENLEHALSRIQTTLPMLERLDALEWAFAQNNLGLILWDRLVGDRGNNIERAMEAFAMALTVVRREETPLRWATMTMNLGKATRERRQGDRTENLERSLALLQDALEIFAPGSRQWAQAQAQLGITYYERLHGHPKINLEASMTALQDALGVLDPDREPLEWARLQTQLGRTLVALRSENQAIHPAQAIQAFRAALTVRKRRTMPLKWAVTSTDLAIALVHTEDEDVADAREEAVQLLRSVARSKVYGTLPIEQAIAEHNLAFAYVNRQLGRPAHNLEQAVTAYRRALDVFDIETFPMSRRHTASDLGDALAHAGRWSEAADAYSEAIAAFSASYGLGLLSTGREAELAAMGPLYRHAAFAAAQLGDLHQTVHLLEQGRARELRESFELDRLDLTELKEVDPEAVRRLDDIARDLRSLENAARDRRMAIDLLDSRAALDSERARARRLRQEFDETLSRLQAHRPRRLSEPSWEEAWSALAADGSMLVYLVPTLFGTCSVLIDGGPMGGHHAPWRIEAVFEDTVTTDALLELLSREHGDSTRVALDSTLKEAARLIGPTILAPLFDRLVERKVDSMILIACGPLNFLPLHGLPFPFQQGVSRWIDTCAVRYAPSARFLALLRQTRASDGPRTPVLLTVADPTLAFSEAEVDAVAFLHKQQGFHHIDGTDQPSAWMLESLGRATHAHFACHGFFDDSEPLRSFLALPEDRLFLGDLFSRRQRCDLDLVVLATCHSTATPLWRNSDEVMALATGFLQAGATSILGSQWKVDDLATALMMIQFYNQLAQTTDPAAALARAQLWLQRLRVDTLLDIAAGDHQALFPSAHSTLHSTEMYTLPPTMADRIHIRYGLEPLDTRPFAAESSWAAFRMIGT